MDYTNLSIYITPYSRALLEKLTVVQQVKKFPVIYGILRIIIVFIN
jgi:hypothetical protein